MRRDQRSPEALAYRRQYSTARWRRIRKDQLERHPFCAMCEAQQRVTVATVCDHVDPTAKLDPTRFYDGPFQSLCDASPWRCHSSRKQQQERSGYATDIGADGMPTDPMHPFNRSAS